MVSAEHNAGIMVILTSHEKQPLCYKDHNHHTAESYKLCLLVHNPAVGQAPTYITDLLQPAANTLSRSSLRTTSHGDYVVLWTNSRFADSQIEHSPLLHHACGTNCRVIL